MTRLLFCLALIGCASTTAPGYDGLNCTFTSHLTVNATTTLDVIACYPVCPADADAIAAAQHQTLIRRACT